MNHGRLRTNKGMATEFNTEHFADENFTKSQWNGKRIGLVYMSEFPVNTDIYINIIVQFG